MPFVLVFIVVAEVVPLKQGLKLYSFILLLSILSLVAEVVPLKQGLKLCFSRPR